MCLATPGEVLRIDGHQAEVSFGGIIRRADLRLLDGVKVGDYVLVHAGCAIQIVPPDEARETLELMREVFGEELP
jgi:hydrogenase expression/formation protein HypC